MDHLADVLLMRAVQAWCDDCGVEQLLVPTEEDAGGLCCTVCDAAVFVVPLTEGPPALRHTA